MRIALALRSFEEHLGGEARWTRGFAAYLRDRGHDVHVVSASISSPVAGVSSVLVPPLWSPPAFAQAVNRHLVALKPDIVHDSGVACWPGVFQPQSGSTLHSLDTAIASQSPARRIRAALSPKMAFLRTGMRRLERAQARTANRIIAISPLVAEILRRRTPDAAAKIVIVPNGVDIGRFAVRGAGAGSGFAEGGPLRVLAAAQNPDLKGVDTTLHALARLRSDGVAARLDVAGAVMDERWRARIAALGLTDCVTFHGFVQDMPAFYAGGDVLAHPARWDAFGLVILEAMAAGLPVVVSRRCGAACFVTDGVEGFLLPEAGDAPSLADRLRRLADRDLRAALAAASFRRAGQASLADNYARVEAELIAACGSTSPAAPGEVRA